ncbi:hypothetical protein K458DRAFT_400813 [Lentithecium fluviatile CBS 122367]|uniref:Uncharacterized protein n=1 Tax=Lentithecium fluviatile CBS 122367 TaxID=1168545 RepID=A0A6G1JDV6_9PLEO|nr:hypothetical protein K458DRAFT_400813 [Lentithecium fluviatile CBS 122367]
MEGDDRGSDTESEYNGVFTPRDSDGNGDGDGGGYDSDSSSEYSQDDEPDHPPDHHVDGGSGGEGEPSSSNSAGIHDERLGGSGDGHGDGDGGNTMPLPTSAPTDQLTKVPQQGSQSRNWRLNRRRHAPSSPSPPSSPDDDPSSEPHLYGSYSVEIYINIVESVRREVFNKNQPPYLWSEYSEVM